LIIKQRLGFACFYECKVFRQQQQVAEAFSASIWRNEEIKRTAFRMSCVLLSSLVVVVVDVGWLWHPFCSPSKHINIPILPFSLEAEAQYTS